MTARRGRFRSSSRRLFTNRFAALALLCIAILALGMAFALSSLLARAVSDWEGENTAALVHREVESRLIGQSFPDNHELKEALEGKVEVEIKTLRRSENVYDPKGGRLAEI